MSLGRTETVRRAHELPGDVLVVAVGVAELLALADELPIGSGMGSGGSPPPLGLGLVVAVDVADGVAVAVPVGVELPDGLGQSLGAALATVSTTPLAAIATAVLRTPTIRR